jgi:polyhydroxybutyrate depolymerase
MKQHVLLPLLFVLCWNSLQAQTVSGSLQHDGITRSYRLYVPPGYTGAEPLPLVFNLHGYGSNASQQEFYSAMNAVAANELFFVCYADGVANQWSTGFGGSADDVGFINKLIDALHAEYQIDLRRVYSCGMSNGGYMSYLLACELEHRIAAVASVTGAMTPAFAANCNPSRPVPVLQIHGTSDDVVPYGGSALNIPIEDLVDFWVAHNACDPVPEETPIPDTNPNDGCTAVRFDYGPCAENTEVVFYRIDNGGHTWPGAPLAIGVTNYDFNASQEIWNFFQQFELDVEVAVSEPKTASKALQLWPNPATSQLHVQTETEELHRAVLYNSQGQGILQIELPGAGTHSLQLPSSLPGGWYLLRLQNSSGTQVARLVLAR